MKPMTSSIQIVAASRGWSPPSGSKTLSENSMTPSEPLSSTFSIVGLSSSYCGGSLTSTLKLTSAVRPATRTLMETR